MAKRIKSNTGVAVFLNGHLLTPHPANKIEQKDHRRSPTFEITRLCVHEATRREYTMKDTIVFSFTNRYALKFGDDGKIVGLSFTEPLGYGDTISVVDRTKWGVNVVHYAVGDDEVDTREITFDE